MKKSLLFILMFCVGVLYARVSAAVSRMLPSERMALAQSMKQTADAYDQAGNKKRAAEYRKAALDVYPLGDEAHILAHRLGTPLDDEKTYQDFVVKADKAAQDKAYTESLSSYLMALELRQPIEIYEKLQMVYLQLGNREMADGLQEILSNVKAPPSETPSMEGPYNQGYQAEAVENCYTEEEYSEAYEAYQEEAEKMDAQEAEEVQMEEPQIMED